LTQGGNTTFGYWHDGSRLWRSGSSGMGTEVWLDGIYEEHDDGSNGPDPV
jgi:hypothetical protein